MSVLQLFRRTDVLDLTSEEVEEFRPMSELEQFAAATRNIVSGLDTKIEALDAEINMKIGQLSDLRRIRAAQDLALRHMEGDL